MKKLFFLFIYTFISSFHKTLQAPLTYDISVTIDCNTNKCVDGAGKCVDFATSNCTCIPEYDTYPISSTIKCNYQKKSQLTAFILELILSYGSGHFYINNINIAIPKFLFWYTGYYLFIILNKKKMKIQVRVHLL